nr:toll/interleukin-1 receptor domain-containing protein [Streptomyces antibioticus]
MRLHLRRRKPTGLSPIPGRDVFISYAREDSPFVEDTLSPWLREQGSSCWVDLHELPGGVHFPTRIATGIVGSKAFLFVLSPDSLASEHCREELTVAVRDHKRLIPVVRREPGDGDIPLSLRTIQWVWWRSPSDDARAKRQLAAALGGDVEWRERQAGIALRTNEWISHGRNRTYLLRGATLAAAERWLADGTDRLERPTPQEIEFITRSRSTRTTRLRAAVAVMLVLTVLMSLLAVVSWTERGRAVRQEREARHQTATAYARELAQRADSARSTDPQLALHLALRGVLKSRTPEGETVLRKVLTAARAREGTPMSGPRSGRLIALGPGANYGVASSSDGRLTVWRLRARSQILRAAPLEGTAVFSLDERLLAVRSSKGTLSVWDLAAEQRVASQKDVRIVDPAGSDGISYVHELGGGVGNVDSVSTSETDYAPSLPDPLRTSGLLAVLPADPRDSSLGMSSYVTTVDRHHVDTWQVVGAGAPQRGRPTQRYTEPGGIDQAWVDPVGQRVVTTNQRGSSVVSAHGTLVSRMPLTSLAAVAFSGDGELMVTVPRSGAPTMVQTGTGEILGTLPGGTARAATFTQDGRGVAVAGADGTLRRHECVPCLPYKKLLDLAKKSLTRPMTPEERRNHLHEEPLQGCPLLTGDARRSCIDIDPNSGPPGSVVEVGFVNFPAGTQRLRFTDARDRQWDLGPVDLPGPYATVRVTVPSGAPPGAGRFSTQFVPSIWHDEYADFEVTCLWC